MSKLFVVVLMVLSGTCSVNHDVIPTDIIKEVDAMTTINGCRVII